MRLRVWINSRLMFDMRALSVLMASIWILGECSSKGWPDRSSGESSDVSHNQLRYMHHLWPSSVVYENLSKLLSSIPGIALVLPGVFIVFVLLSNLVNLLRFCNLCANLLTGTPRVLRAAYIRSSRSIFLSSTQDSSSLVDPIIQRWLTKNWRRTSYSSAG